MHTKTRTKKTYPSQSSCNPLDAIIVSHVHKLTTRPLPKFRAAKQTQQIASSSEASPTFGHANANLNDHLHLHDQMSGWLRHCSRADRTAPISKRFLFPNITYILIIHSGPVARTVPIKNHGQDSSTSQLESIRFKYLRLK